MFFFFNATAPPELYTLALTTLFRSTAISAYLMTDEGEAAFDEMYGWTDIRRAVESDFDIVREAAAILGITEP